MQQSDLLLERRTDDFTRLKKIQSTGAWQTESQTAYVCERIVKRYRITSMLV